jgi:hypothetical protein
MDMRVLVGLLEVVGLALAPVAMVSVLVRVNLIYEACMSLGRRLYLFHTPPARPAGPPLEKLAADLRRLRPAARMPRPDVPMAQQRRSLAAYDAVLVATARALDVPTTLGELTEGFEREVERRHLEHALEEAGLSWQLHQD